MLRTTLVKLSQLLLGYSETFLVRSALGGSVGRLLDLGSGCNLTGHGFKPHNRLATVGVKPALGPLYLLLTAPPLLVLSQNK